MKIRAANMGYADIRRALYALIAATLAICCVCPAATAATPKTEIPKRLVIIDQDAFGPAGSNLQAILLLLQTSGVELLGITIVSGDGWRDQGIARRTPHPTDPYLVPASPAGAPHIKAAADSAADFLVRELHRYPGQVTIIAAGPLTNLALAVRLDPKFSSLAKELVFMGGSFNPRPSNNAFAAEYANAPRRELDRKWDPEAASMVLHEPWRKITQVPIDPTTKTFFTADMSERIARGSAPFAKYIGKFGQSYPMWDELAVAAWLDPSIVTAGKQLLVDVDTSFTAGYGDTLSWSIGEGPGLGEKPVQVVLDIDLPKFEALTMDLLSRRAAGH